MGNHDELLRKRAAREAGVDPYATPADPDDVEVTLEVLRQRADTVQEHYEDFEEAIMDEREAAAQVMDTALVALAPALDAMVGKIETRRASVAVRDGDGKLQMKPVGQASHYELRGVLIVNRFDVFLDGDRVQEESGAYGGHGLYVLENGLWALAKRSGTWSRRPGEPSLYELALEPAPSIRVLQNFRVEVVLGGLLEAMAKQDKLPAATERTRQRTAVLREGLITLLQGLKA